MEYSSNSIDEHVLAAFLSGQLSEEERQKVMSRLAEDSELRDLLCMAHQALEAGREPANDAAVVDLRDRNTGPIADPADRPARKQRVGRRHVRRLLAAVALVLGVGLGIHLIVGPPTDDLRSNGDNVEMSVRIDTPDLHFRWDEVRDVYEYRLVVWDPLEARVVGRHVTQETELGNDDAFVRRLESDLDSDRSYTLRIDAIDAQNRLIKSSDAIDFQLE